MPSSEPEEEQITQADTQPIEALPTIAECTETRADNSHLECPETEAVAQPSLPPDSIEHTVIVCPCDGIGAVSQAAKE